jgi:hypothetical protein
MDGTIEGITSEILAILRIDIGYLKRTKIKI